MAELSVVQILRFVSIVCEVPRLVDDDDLKELGDIQHVPSAIEASDPLDSKTQRTIHRVLLRGSRILYVLTGAIYSDKLSILTTSFEVPRVRHILS